MRSRWSAFFYGLFFFVGAVLLFQNCHQFGDMVHQLLPVRSFQGNCLEAPINYTCVINKNLVYERGEVFSEEGLDYRDLFLKPVRLELLDGSGFLKNDTFQVLSYEGKQVSTSGSLKFGYEVDNGVSLSQVMSYYYSSLAMKFSPDKDLSLVGNGLYIITQAPVTGWSSEDNTIYLGLETKIVDNLVEGIVKSEGGKPSKKGKSFSGQEIQADGNLDDENRATKGEVSREMGGEGAGSLVQEDSEENSLGPLNQHDNALDGSIILNLVSEANIYYATKGAINKQMESKHRDCQSQEQMCCINEEGCSKAISIGLSMYFSSHFFPEAPTVGESYSNRLTGIEDCGVSRDLNVSESILVSEAFVSCGEENKGYVYPMATVYASIWWSVRKEILASRPEEAKNFQIFYLEHLKELHGDLNFIDAYQLIEELDSKSFGSVFGPYFNSEFVRRGLSISLGN